MRPIESAGSRKKEQSMITFFKRKGKLYVQFESNGKKYQRSTKLDDTPKNRAFVTKKVIPKLQMKILRGEFGERKDAAKEFNFYSTKYKESKINLKTYPAIRGMVDNKIYDVFGKMKIDTIKRADVKDFADTLLKELSSKRTRMILNVLIAILDIAIDYEHIVANPASNIKLPKHIPSRVMMPFTKEEVTTLLSKADGWFQNLIAVSFYTGMRPGEVIALTWTDIDLDNMVIDVNKRIAHGIVDTPKTKSSIRKVPIFEPLKPYLENQLRICKKEMSLYVFSNPYTKERFYDSKKLMSFWYNLLNKCEYDKRVFYNSRHTFVTNMIRSGKVSILDISQMVGHKTIQETISTYAKYLPQEHLKVSRSLDVFTDNLTDSSSQTPRNA